MKIQLYILTIIFTFLLNEGRTQIGTGFLSKNKEPETVKELTESLTAGLSNDSLIVLQIYKWITHNVSYDYTAYMSGQPIRYQSHELVFKRRLTTCTGYSNLMVAMLDYSGVPAYTVEGFTQDYILGLDTTKLSSDHAWVAFSLNGNWHVADPTWDAGNIGLIKTTEVNIVKRTFWQKLKAFQFKDLFKKNKSKKKDDLIKRTKVSYKMGFTSQPTMEYIFCKPGFFLKTHLPNVAHIQMKTSPICIRQFCDSANAIGDCLYTCEGNFNYNSLNDKYYSLEIPERLLWLSDSSLNFHSLNHGDKALNAHNYLAHFYGEKTENKAVLEKFVSVADTVLIHGDLAIKINKSEYKKKKNTFGDAFQIEKKLNYAQEIQIGYIKSNIARTTEIYRRGREIITQKELGSIAKFQNRFNSKYGVGFTSGIPSGWENIAKAREMVEAIHALRDSVVKYQNLEKLEGPNHVNGLLIKFNAARLAIYNNTNELNAGRFLNEEKILQKDQEVLDSLILLNDHLRDSINLFLASRKSYAYTLKLNQEINKQAALWNALEKKDSLVDASAYQAYSESILSDLIKVEKEIIEYRLDRSVDIETAMNVTFRNETKEIGLDMRDLTYIKNMRQAYLTKMMNNKYNRSIKVYQMLINNAKSWKGLYKTKLKNLEERV